MKKQNILIIGLILLAVISFGIFILVSGKENTGSLETTKDIIKMINIIDKDNKRWRDTTNCLCIKRATIYFWKYSSLSRNLTGNTNIL